MRRIKRGIEESFGQLFVTPWTAACQVSLSFIIFQSLLKLMSIELVMPSNHFILCTLFSSCPQSFPVSGSFPTSWLFTLGGQSTGASASASVLPMNIQDWFPLPNQNTATKYSIAAPFSRTFCEDGNLLHLPWLLWAIQCDYWALKNITVLRL